VPLLTLMENAGSAVAEFARSAYPTAKTFGIICGKGNNGGDGFVIARHLDNFGWPVKVLLFAKPSELAGDAAVMFEIVKRSGLKIEYFAANAVRFEDYLNDELTNFGDGWIVDALFGTGLSGAVREPFDRVIAAINASPAPVLAVDIPSGLDCDTGQPLGIAVRADVTATFVDRKAGFFAEEAQPWLGEVHVLEIGAPRALVAQYR
jgi:NAD(P)H-hydrate epimerase